MSTWEKGENTEGGEFGGRARGQWWMMGKEHEMENMILVLVQFADGAVSSENEKQIQASRRWEFHYHSTGDRMLCWIFSLLILLLDEFSISFHSLPPASKPLCHMIYFSVNTAPE